MTASLPETKTGLRSASPPCRDGLSAQCVRWPAFSFAHRGQPGSPRLNGPISVSDVALAGEKLDPARAEDPAAQEGQASCRSDRHEDRRNQPPRGTKTVKRMRISRKRTWRSRAALLMDSCWRAKGKAATTDDAMKKVYETPSKQNHRRKEVQAGISCFFFVETEGDATGYRRRAQEGRRFAEIAKKKSKDPARPTRGDLGYSPGSDGAGISTVAFALETARSRLR